MSSGSAIDNEIRDRYAAITYYRIVSHPMTAIDYMHEYNEQVVNAAISNFANYVNKLEKDVRDAEDAQEIIFQPKALAAKATKEAAVEAAHAINSPEAIDAAFRQYRLTINEATKIGKQALVSPLNNLYTEAVKEAKRLWENMLPFARCTDDPADAIADLYHYAMFFVNETCSTALSVASVPFGGSGPTWDLATGYTTGLTEADAAEALKAQREMEEWMAKNRWDGTIQSWPLEEFTFSVQVGDLEFKLGTTKVEVEYANGFAGKVGFDWKKKEVSFGVGVAVKAAIGFSNNGAQLVGAEAKFYGNLVIDLKKNQVTEVSVSVEGKFNVLETAETGGQIKYTFYGDGKGWSASAQAKAKLGWAALELDQELF